MIYVLHRSFGHYFVEGVGYATIQSILGGQLSLYWLLALLFACKLLGTSLSLGSGASGGIFSPSLFMGATIGGAFAGLVNLLPLPVHVGVPSFAMVGMGAMVGGGTGAVLTAVAMIFEMTQDYNIVLPMIVAVALSVGVRRLLSAESIYTIKLVRRGQVVPKALHANMFLVRRAGSVMHRDAIVAPAEADFGEFLRQPEHRDRMLHVVVTRGGHIAGVLRVNNALHRGRDRAFAGETLGDMASPAYTIAREQEVVSDVIRRMWRRKAIMAVVVRGEGVPRATDVVGVLTKEHVADSVAASIEIYPR